MSRQPGRKRDEAARQAILAATYALLLEQGFERLSIEGVAARAGVGKTTIYRWWLTKGVLVVEAFLTATEPLIAFPQSPSARDDILRQMQALAALYRGPTGRVIREIIGAAQYDPAMREQFVSGFIGPRREQAHAVVRRGMAAGELRADIDADVVMDALWAPIYYRLLASNAPIDEATVTAHAAVVLRGLAP